MNGARRFGGAMTADAARERKLLEELPESRCVFAFVAVDLRIRAFKINRSEDARSAAPGSGKKYCVDIIFLDDPVQMNVNKRQPRRGAPVSEQPIFDVLRFQRFPQQRVVLKVDHPKA